MYIFLFLVINNRWHEEPQCENPVIKPITHLLTYFFLLLISFCSKQVIYMKKIYSLKLEQQQQTLLINR